MGVGALVIALRGADSVALSLSYARGVRRRPPLSRTTRRPSAAASIRPYWRCYFPGTDALVFVVDSTDVERLATARAELAVRAAARGGARGAARLRELRGEAISVSACDAKHSRSYVCLPFADAGTRGAREQWR